MNLRQLEYFVHVAELASFTKAASQLSIAQSALSHHVRELEIEFKQSLLHRNGRGVSLTDSGRRLLAHARGILAQVGRARDEMAESTGAPVGHVVLGLPPSTARLLTVRLVNSFRSSFPRASCGIVEGLSVYIVDWVMSGHVDIGLVYNPLPSPAIEIIPLQEQQLFLISPKLGRTPRGRSTVQTKDLIRYPLIIPSRHNANRIVVEGQLARLGLKPQIALEIDGIASVLDLVHEGHGHAVLPINSLVGHSWADEFLVRRLVSPRLTIPLSLVISAQRPANALMRETLRLIREVSLQPQSSGKVTGTVSRS